jgi:NADH-quinone oxidoreductase subunit H
MTGLSDTILNSYLQNAHPAWLVLAALAWALVAVGGIGLAFAGLLTLAERKVAGHVQSRFGPNRILGHGLTQFVADAIKLVLKEDIIPANADRILFRMAPYVVNSAFAAVFVAMPFGPRLMATDINTGIYYIAAVGSFVVIGIVMSGYASNNKWSLLGGLRSAAQVVSYEVPIGLAVLVVILATGSLSMQRIVEVQGAWGGMGWNIIRSPFLFIAFWVYFIASIAENNRTPFDLPEAESELVAGYNTEYSGIRFGVFFMAEFGNVWVVAALSTALFLGGWQIPIIGTLGSGNFWVDGMVGFGVFLIKSLPLTWLILMLRWTLPRLRVDQLMNICWKYLVPAGFLCILGQAAWMLLIS